MSQRIKQVLVIGGGYAGLLAASRAAKAGNYTQVTLIEPRTHFVQRIRLHEIAAGGEPKTLIYEKLLAKRSIQYLQGWVVGIDLDNQQAKIETPNGAVQQHYDYLVYAVGSEFEIPSYLVKSPNLYSIHNEEKSRMLFERLSAVPKEESHKLLVIGDGFTAIELCAELAERFQHCHVSMAGSSQPFAQFSDKAQKHLNEVFCEHSIRFISDRVVDCTDNKIQFSNDTHEKFDSIVYCGGFRSSLNFESFKSELPLSIDEKSRVKVNSCLQIENYPNHYVAGDVGVVELESDSQKSIRMGCVSAMPMGAHAGNNIADMIKGEAPKPFRFGFAFRCLSLGRKNGLIQFTNEEDVVKDSILSGRAAALFKEFICRLTYYSILMEYKTGLPVFVWLQPKNEPQPKAKLIEE